MKQVLAVAVVVVAALAAPAEDRKPGSELALFTGTWKGVSAVHDGKAASKEDAETLTLVVKGDKYTLSHGKLKAEGTHTLDASHTPKRIDAVRTSGPHKGEKMLGVYELTEDTFKVCFAAPGKERPKSLASEEGTHTRLMTLKRAKK